MPERTETTPSQKSEKDKDKKEKGIFDVAVVAFKKIIQKIKQLLQKKKEQELSKDEQTFLQKLQHEKKQRKEEFFATPFGKQVKEALDQQKEELQKQAEDIKKQKDPKKAVQALRESQAKKEQAKKTADQKDQQIEDWEKQQQDIDEGRYTGIAEDEMEQAIEQTRKEEEKAAREIAEQEKEKTSDFYSSKRPSLKEIINKRIKAKEKELKRPLSYEEKSEIYANAVEEYERQSLREPYSEMFLRQIKKEINAIKLSEDQKVQVQNKEQLLKTKTRVWLKEKLKGISNVGGPTREHTEAMRLMQSFLEEDRIGFYFGEDDLFEIKIEQEWRDLFESWTKLHDFGEHFASSGSAEQVQRAASMLETEYFAIMMQEKDKINIEKVTYKKNGQKKEIKDTSVSLGAADFLDFYDSERWGEKVISRNVQEREQAKKDLAKDVIATTLGIKDWKDEWKNEQGNEIISDLQVEFTYIDEEGRQKTGDFQRLLDEYRWANKFAEKFYHQFGRAAYHDVDFSGEVKDWQTKVLRFPRYTHMYGIGIPELRDVCSLDYHDFITERQTDLLPILNKRSPLYSEDLSSDQKDDLQKAIEKAVLDSKGWLMSKERMLRVAHANYHGKRDKRHKDREMNSREKGLVNKMDFTQVFESMGIDVPESKRKGINGLLTYIENLSYANMDWSTGIWGQRPYKYYEYLNNANVGRTLMMAYLNQPTIEGLAEALGKGFGYYGTEDRWEKAKKITQMRQWGLTFHGPLRDDHGIFEKLDVKENNTSSQQAKDENGKKLFDDEGNIIYKTKTRILGVPWKDYGYEAVPDYEWKSELDALLGEHLINREIKNELEKKFYELGLPSIKIPIGVPFIGGMKFGPGAFVGRIRRLWSRIPKVNFLLKTFALIFQKIKEELEEELKES